MNDRPASVLTELLAEQDELEEKLARIRSQVEAAQAKHHATGALRATDRAMLFTKAFPDRRELDMYVVKILGPDKAAKWWETPNPILGNLSPKAMMQLGRTEKVYRFIAAAREANGDTPVIESTSHNEEDGVPG